MISFKTDQAPESIWQNPWHFIACGFGAGFFPYAPGTIGTLAAIPFIVLLAKTSLMTYVITCALLFAAGIWLCGKVNRDFKTEDHRAAVFDELSTFPVALIGIPLHWYWMLIAFVLFRFFDIIKPGPIGWIDRHMHGGLGVMSDDLLAALATLIVLHVIVGLFGQGWIHVN